MLKQRLLTAIILIPLAVWAILALPAPVVAAVFGLIILLGSWEWSRLSGNVRVEMRILYAVLVAAGMYLLWQRLGDSSTLHSLLFIALAWWLGVFVWLALARPKQVRTGIFVWIKLGAGMLILIPAWFATVSLHAGMQGPYWLLYILVLVWLADSGAYFAGRAWGRHKLAPSISPGKTWEGVAGAILVILPYAVVVSLWLGLSGGVQAGFILYSLAMVPISIAGDLFESLVKRESGHKDSGTLLPGHGGIMDRIDSLTAVMPLFLLSMIELELL